MLPLLLFASAISTTIAPDRASEGGTTSSVVLPAKAIEPVPIEMYSTTNVIQYSMRSNASVTIALMTSQNFQRFNASKSGVVSDSIFYKNGTEDKESLNVATGSYDLVLYAFGRTARVTLSYQLYPHNPLVNGTLPVPEPTGIASFGLTNQSGTDSPYSVRATDVIGVAKISALQAYNATAESTMQIPDSAISLQLNSNIVLDESGGNSQVYWLQNTPVFVTVTSQVQLADNIWNSTGTGNVLNANGITSEGGLGSIYTDTYEGTTEYYYDYEGVNSTYSLPMGLILLENSTVEPGQGVLVQFGARVIDQGAPANQPRDDWFDNVTIHAPTVQSAYLLTSGNDTEPGGLFYDTEFVFAGDASSESTNFTAMDSELGLYYTNGTSSPSLTSFPSYFSFGWDTAESADDLRVTYPENGVAQLSVGTPDYDYLGSAGGTSTLKAVESTMGIPMGPESSSSTSSSTSSSSSTGAPTSTTSATATTTPTSAAPEFPSWVAPYLLVGVLVVVAVSTRMRNRFLSR
jgi:thermopsin